MSVKRVFFGVLQKIMVICCAIFFGFANAFSANLPSGYTELEYIESTGTQWIDTGYSYKNEMTQTQVKFAFTSKTSSGRNLFGCSKNDIQYITMYESGSSMGIYVGQGVKASVVRKDYNPHTVDIFTSASIGGDLYITIDGIQDRFVKNASNISDANMGIFTQLDSVQTSLHLNRQGAYKVYSFIMIDGGTVVRNFIPARRNSDGEVGMYDTVSGTFFTNSGTGEFTAGPVVGIRIATTAYNTAQFNPVVTDLNSTIATIREIVTNTINQTAAIASLQADKQTRPEDACPAGKKCLLVETEENGVIVPHWFPIIETPEE